MTLEKLEYVRGQGLIIDNKKYGSGITKVEIDGIDIKIYINKNYMLKNFDECIKDEEWKDNNNPYDLIKYENIKIIEE